MDDPDGRILRIFVGEDDEHDGRPLYEAIVLALREHGMAGATVQRGIMGFGRSSVLHTAKVLRLSEDLPVVIECVDSMANVERVIPVLDALVDDGLVTVECVEIRSHRAGGPR